MRQFRAERTLQGKEAQKRHVLMWLPNSPFEIFDGCSLALP